MKTKLILIPVFIINGFTVVSQNIQQSAFSFPKKPAAFSLNQKQHIPASAFTPSDPFYDSIYVYKIDAAKAWSAVFKAVDIVYNSNKDIVSLTRKDWENEAWNNYAKYVYAYDASYNKTNSLVLRWNGNNWINDIQQTITYIANKSDVIIQQQWNDTANAWDNVGKTMYTYDSNGNQVIEEFQPWDKISNTWFPFRRIASTYTPDNNLKERLLQSYQGSSWVDFYRVLFQYDIKGNNTSVTTQRSDPTEDWINETKIESVFDNNNNLFTEKSFQWTDADSTWEEYSKSSDYSWNANKNLLAYKTENLLNGNYLLSGKYRAAYNSSSHLVDEVYLELEGDDAAITAGDSTHYFIHDIAGNVSDLKANKNSISIYPNPSNGSFTISTESKRPVKTLEVYNIVGERIFQQHLSNQVTLPNVTTGIYFVKVDDGTGVYTRKITIQ